MVAWVECVAWLHGWVDRSLGNDFDELVGWMDLCLRENSWNDKSGFRNWMNDWMVGMIDFVASE